MSINEERFCFNGEMYTRETWDMIIRNYANDMDRLQNVLNKYGIYDSPGTNIIDVVIKFIEEHCEEQNG